MMYHHYHFVHGFLSKSRMILFWLLLFAQVKSAAQYMAAKRSFQGLEAPVMGAERKEAGDIKEGRKGRAAQYVNETQWWIAFLGIQDL